MDPIDFTKVVPIAEFSGEDAEDDALLKEMAERGRAYLSSFGWCGEIVDGYMGDIAVGGVVAVLLFKIVPARDGVDDWVWVIVGDLPPAYITVDDAPNPACALDGYIGAMQEWIAAVKSGKSVEGLIPVETSAGDASLEPTPETADRLERRLRFLDEEILESRQSDLGEAHDPA